MIVAQMDTGINLNYVTINCILLLAMIRDTHAKWIIEIYQKLCSAESCKTLIINGFEKCGILDLRSTIQVLKMILFII